MHVAATTANIPRYVERNSLFLFTRVHHSLEKLLLCEVCVAAEILNVTKYYKNVMFPIFQKRLFLHVSLVPELFIRFSDKVAN